MTDGPHKSLPMNRHWKKAAQLADSDAFQEGDIIEATLAALIADWKSIPTSWMGKLAASLDDQDDMLFRNIKSDKIELLRMEHDVNPLASVILDVAVRQVEENAPSLQAKEKVSEKSLGIWLARRVRQIEEHYRRESTGVRALKVYKRLEGAIKAAFSHDLVNKVIIGARHGLSRMGYRKKTGLDDGVAL